MADVTIDATLQTAFASQWVGHRHIGPFWTSNTTGYVVYIDAGGDVNYSKTTDSGATWGAGVQVDTSVSNQVDAWADWETPGDSGTKIHVVCSDDSNNRVNYRNLDTSSDTLSTRTTAISASTVVPGDFNNNQLSITKARGGNLFVWSLMGASVNFVRSTDGGGTWGARSTTGLWESDNEDHLSLIPAGDTDSNDIAAIFIDDSADQLSFKLHDDSGNSWGTETAIGSVAAIDWPDDYWGWDAAVRHSDNKVIIAWWDNRDAATADLNVSVLTLTAAGANATALTDVLTDTGEAGECCVMIDNNTDDLYAGYLRGGTWGTTVTVYYKKSTDDGSTWGSEVTLSETAGLYKMVSSQHGVKSGGSGRFMPVWIHETNDDLLTNQVNSVEITAGGGSPAFTPRITLLGVG